MRIDPRWLATVLAVTVLGCHTGDSLAPADDFAGSITATPVDMHSVQVSWSVIDGARGYQLERRANLQGGLAPVGGTFPKGATGYFDRGLTPNTVYGYRVRAIDDFGSEMAHTTVAGARTAPEPGIQVVVQSILGGDARFSTDSNGYQARVRLGQYDQRLPVAVTGGQLFQPLDPGIYQVTLDDIAPNCAVVGEAVHAVAVTSSGLNTIASTSFTVNCRDRTRGRVTAVLQANGDTTDTDGFRLALTGLADDKTLADSIRAVVIRQTAGPTGGDAVFDNVRPGTYSLTIEGVAPYCTVEGKVQRDGLKVEALGDFSELFSVTCNAVGGGGPNGPYTFRAAWQPDTAPAASIVKLSTSIDMGQGNPKSLAGFQFQVSTPGGGARLDSIVNRTPGFLFTGNVQSSTQGIVLGSKIPGVASGVVPLADFYYTVTGTDGRSVRPQLGGILFGTADGGDFTSETKLVVGTFTVGTKRGSSNNQPPIAQANGPYTGAAGNPVAFSGAGSSDADGTIAGYAWDFGDGQTGTGQSATHSYSSAGSYTARLTVTDDKGATASATAGVTVTPSGAQSTPFTWQSSFGTINPSDNTVLLTISLDLSADIPETAGTEALADVVIDSLKWNKNVLQYLGITLGSAGGSVNFLQTGNGKLSFRGPVDAAKSTGVVPIGVVRFQVLGATGASTTTQTAIGSLTSTAGIGSYAYKPRTKITEGTLTVAGGGSGTTTVSGTVTSSLGGGLSGVTVTLSPGGGSASTASGGAYTLVNVAAGSYGASLSGLPAGCTAPAAKSVTVASTPVTGVDFAVACTASGGVGSVTGTVVKSGGAGPIANASVQVSGGFNAMTGSNGSYSVSNVLTGSHTVTVSSLPQGCSAPAAQTVTVPNGGSVGANFAVTCTAPAGTGTVQGQVAFSSGSGTPSLAGATVKAAPANNGQQVSVAPSPAGAYTIANVPIANGTGTVVVSGLPAGCTPAAPSVGYTGLTAGGTVTAPVITITCPTTSNNYPFAVTFTAPSAGKITMKATIDMSTRNDPQNNGSGPDLIGGFQALITYPTSRLSGPVCTAGALSGPINVSTAGRIVPVLTNVPAGATGNNVNLFTCTFDITGTGPTPIGLTSPSFGSPTGADFTAFVDITLADVP